MSAAHRSEPLHESSRQRWWVVGLLFLAILINYVDRGNLSIAAVPLMKDFSLSPPEMGTLLSSFFWTYAALQIPAGVLLDRYGLRWVYGASFLLWSLATAAMALADSFSQILVCRLMLGVGEAVAAPASLGYIRRSFPQEESGLPTAVYTTGMMLGPAVGSLAGALLLDSWGWRSLFLITGLGTCWWVIPWLWLAPREGRRAAPSAGYTAHRVRWNRVFSNPLFWGITIAAFLYSYYWYFFLTWIPSYLVMTHGFSFAKMGTATAIPLAGMALVAAGAARLADRRIAASGKAIETRRAFVTAGLLLGCLVLLLLVFRSRMSVFPILLFSMLGLGLASANYWALTQAISPPSMVSRVVAYQNTVANVAGIVAPVATGWLLGADKNFDAAIACAGIALLLAAVAYRLLVRPKDVERFHADCGYDAGSPVS